MLRNSLLPIKEKMVTLKNKDKDAINNNNI